MPISYKVVGLNELNKALERSAKQVDDILRIATDKAVKYAHEQIPPYPGASGEPYPFKSRRQYLFVLLSILEGSMRVPYRRSGTLGRTITDKVQKVGRDWVGTVGTDTVYAPWVISVEEVGSRGPQSQYHKGTWWTLQEVIKKAKDGILKIYKSELRARLFR